MPPSTPPPVETLADLLERIGDVPPARIRMRPAPGTAGPYGRAPSIRQAFEVAFGYDPSDPRDSVSASIPQALSLMNGVRINLAVRAVGDETVLGRLMTQIKDNDALVEELYLRTLSREPTEKELDAALAYCKSTKNRAAVFEDLFWALLNSSEFSHRR